MISVIIPTFNREQMLQRAVQSVLQQTYTNFELIVVDDGSTDQTAILLQSINDPRFIYLRQENQGVAAARNTGIAKSQGKYITLLDADDAWLPQKLEKQLRFTWEGGWSISHTDEIWYRYGIRVNPALKHAKKAGWLFEPALELCLISPSCAMFHREVCSSVGLFDQHLPAAEDYDFWLRCSLSYEVGYCPEQLTCRFAGHSDQLSRKIVGLDLYRMYSLINLLKAGNLTAGQRNLLLSNLQERARRYRQGCLKRDKPEEAKRIACLIEQYRSS